MTDLHGPTIRYMIRELYLSAYYNHDELDDVEPGYEYAVQQLLCDIRERRLAFTSDLEMEEMNNAQDAYCGDTDE